MQKRISISVRSLVMVGLVMVIAACAIITRPGGGTILFAQSLPATLHATWTPRPASENVTDYQFTLDNGTALLVPLTACTATLCSTAFTVPAFGPHTGTVLARNLKLSTDPTSFQNGAPASLPFVLNQGAGAVTGGAITN